MASSASLCQRTGKKNPLDDCPPRTIFVSKSDARADFTTIQGAILSLPDGADPYTILVAPGEYNEQLNVTRPGPLTLLGVSDRPWKSELYGDVEFDTQHQNDVTVRWDSANHDAIFTDNVFTGALTVAPTLDASLTGSGPTGFPVPEGTPFGCRDFRAYNIDFRNEEFPYSNGPAHAVGVSYANAGFYSCGLYGYQDTLYVGKLGNAYFYDTVIAGQTDFIYGFGTAWIERSTLLLRNCGGGIIAWKGTNTSFVNKYGAYISRARVLAANATIAEAIVGKCALGRPWNSQHRSIFMSSYLDASILPAGYKPWSSPVNNYTLMATFHDFGPGYDVEAERASNITIVLDKNGVEPYDRPEDVFLTEDGKPKNVGWIDRSVLARK
ncbi:hypothetical protein VTK73DRAFT_9563 [Phialemonium thermophilum]|uniref:pectinesterase n=1 Tax=Phialemonium thermophilum TaxID=223376 RepID=A0ABR3W219_9PEZI